MSSIEDMMKKAVTTSNTFYQDRNAVQGYKDRKDNIRKKKREQKDTLTQWYGMKKRQLNEDEKQELELLQYRNFLNPDTQHQAPKRSSNMSSDFVEFGYFAETGKNKRKRLKSFADEWITENQQFEEIVKKRMKKNVKLNKKLKIAAAKRTATEAARQKAKKSFKKRLHA
ncbi:unnamed protein product [Phytomonas sp. Hart1]|nr:unnamed protein product [Phytomonas sp. Hart1]|eukprot:CCW70858.1 unnamed protein product [Phytomonas sp. isolate Hart1]